MQRAEYRIVFLDKGCEYLKPRGFNSEWEAREYAKSIAPGRRPQVLRVIAGFPPDQLEDEG